MAISSLDDLKDSYEFKMNFQKSPSVARGFLGTTWTSAAKPGAAPSTPTTCDNTTIGAMNKETPIGSTDSDWRLNSVTSNMGGGLSTQYLILDRLSHSGGLATNTTSPQTTNLPTAALTRYTNGYNVFIFLEFYASTAGSTVTTATVSYTNQDGTPGRTSKPAVIGASTFGGSETGRFLMIPFQDGDTGIRSVESVTLDADTGAAGNFGITLFKIVAMTGPVRDYLYSSNFYHAILGGAGHLEPILPGACLSLVNNGQSSSGSLNGTITFSSV